MKTLIFAVSTALALACLAGAILYGATHQLFLSLFCGIIARVLFTDRAYDSASPRYVLLCLLAKMKRCSHASRTKSILKPNTEAL